MATIGVPETRTLEERGIYASPKRQDSVLGVAEQRQRLFDERVNTPFTEEAPPLIDVFGGAPSEYEDLTGRIRQMRQRQQQSARQIVVGSGTGPGTTPEIKVYGQGAPDGEAKAPEVNWAALATPAITGDDVARANRQIEAARQAASPQAKAEATARQNMHFLRQSQIARKLPGMSEDERTSVERVMSGAEGVSAVDIDRTISILEEALPQDRRGPVTSSQRETARILNDLKKTQQQGTRTGRAIAKDTERMEGLNEMSFGDWEKAVQAKVSELPATEQPSAYRAAMENAPKAIQENQAMERQIRGNVEQRKALTEAEQDTVVRDTFERNVAQFEKIIGEPVTFERMQEDPELMNQYYETMGMGQFNWVEGRGAPQMYQDPTGRAKRQTVTVGGVSLPKAQAETLNLSGVSRESVSTATTELEQQFSGRSAPSAEVTEISGKSTATQIANAAAVYKQENPNATDREALEAGSRKAAEGFAKITGGQYNADELLQTSYKEAADRYLASMQEKDNEKLATLGESTNAALDTILPDNTSLQDFAEAVPGSLSDVPTDQLSSQALQQVQGAMADRFADLDAARIPTAELTARERQIADIRVAQELKRREEQAVKTDNLTRSLITKGVQDPLKAKEYAEITAATENLPQGVSVTDTQTALIIQQTETLPASLKSAVMSSLSTGVPGLYGSTNPEVSPIEKLASTGIYRTDDPAILRTMAGGDDARYARLREKWARTPPVGPDGRRNLDIDAMTADHPTFVGRVAELYADNDPKATAELTAEFDRARSFVVGELQGILEDEDGTLAEDKFWGTFRTSATFEEFQNTEAGLRLKKLDLKPSTVAALYNGMKDDSIRPMLESKDPEVRRRGMYRAMVNNLATLQGAMDIKTKEVITKQSWMLPAIKDGYAISTEAMVEMHKIDALNDVQGGGTAQEVVNNLQGMKTAMQKAVRAESSQLERDYNLKDVAEYADPFSGEEVKVSRTITQIDNALAEIAKTRGIRPTATAGSPEEESLRTIRSLSAERPDWVPFRPGEPTGTAMLSVAGVPFTATVSGSGDNAHYTLTGPDGRDVTTFPISPAKIEKKAQRAVIKTLTSGKDLRYDGFLGGVRFNLDMAFFDAEGDLNAVKDYLVEKTIERKGLTPEAARQVIDTYVDGKVAETREKLMKPYADKLQAAVLKYLEQAEAEQEQQEDFDDALDSIIAETTNTEEI